MQQQPDLEVKKFFDTLSRTSSIKAKKQMLAEKRDDGNIKKFLDYLLNPFFVTGISEKKIEKVVPRQVTVHFDSFHELMSYVRKNHTGSDDILANIQAFLNHVESDLRSFYSGIITKSIRIGCDVKTVNDALGYELIPQWEVQQAYQIGKLKMNENEWFSLSPKLNGVLLRSWSVMAGTSVFGRPEMRVRSLATTFRWLSALIIFRLRCT